MLSTQLQDQEYIAQFKQQAEEAFSAVSTVFNIAQ
jgi:hypothetical protein